MNLDRETACAVRCRRFLIDPKEEMALAIHLQFLAAPHQQRVAFGLQPRDQRTRRRIRNRKIAALSRRTCALWIATCRRTALSLLFRNRSRCRWRRLGGDLQ